MANRILSIDWDYITGDCQEDDTNHCGYCTARLHSRPPTGRGALNLLVPEWKEVLEEIKELKVPRKIPVYVAECHAEMVKVAMRHYSDDMIVTDFDHHFDDYWPDSDLTCGNWISILKKIVPKFEVEKAVRNYTYAAKAIFFCRSAPWTPSEMDADFLHLVHYFCKKTGSPPTFVGHMGKKLRKIFNHIHPDEYGSFMVLEG